MANQTSSADGTGRRLLDPSELGTQEYWDAAYAREIENHEHDVEDEGTIWFSESNAEEAILAELRALEEAGLLRRGLDTHSETNGSANLSGSGNINSPSSPAPPSRFLDLGTGNGHLLFVLREEDDDDLCWQGEMVGVDYSPASVQLSRSLATQKQLDDIRFEQWDLLNSPPGDWLKGGFDTVLDKGTFDAISLMPQAEAQSHPCEVYLEKVVPLIKPGFFLLITSCNWTKAELLDWLAPSNGLLKYYAEAKYPTFTFGGQTGQSIVTLVLQRRKDIQAT